MRLKEFLKANNLAYVEFIRKQKLDIIKKFLIALKNILTFDEWGNTELAQTKALYDNWCETYKNIEEGKEDGK